jgi:hypothetical protein
MEGNPAATGRDTTGQIRAVQQKYRMELDRWIK